MIVQRRKRKIQKSLRGRARERAKERERGGGGESFNVYYHFLLNGSGDSSVVERRTRDRKVAGSSPRRNGGGRIVFSRVNFLCGFLFWYPFHPHVTAAAHKRCRLICQKCRWQVTAKHKCTLWLSVTWHCKVVHVCTVYTEHARRWKQFHTAPTV